MIWAAVFYFHFLQLAGVGVGALCKLKIQPLHFKKRSCLHSETTMWKVILGDGQKEMEVYFRQPWLFRRSADKVWKRTLCLIHLCFLYKIRKGVPASPPFCDAWAVGHLKCVHFTVLVRNSSFGHYTRSMIRITGMLSVGFSVYYNYLLDLYILF